MTKEPFFAVVFDVGAETMTAESVDELSRQATRVAATRGVERQRLLDLFGVLAAGDLSAMESLYDTCASDLYGLALWRTGSSADAWDVVHDVFVRLAQLGETLSKVRRPRGYLLTMTHRLTVDLGRARQRRPTTPLEECRFLESNDASPEASLDAERAGRLLAVLSGRQREVLYLRHYAGLTFAGIGRVTGVSTFTAASRYRLGIRRLRRLMGVS